MMKKIIKQAYWLIFNIFILMIVLDCPGLFAQISSTKGYIAEEDTIPWIKILTPLGHQPNNDYDYDKVNWMRWTEQQLESCYQNWLHDGGVFLHNGDCTFTEKNNFLQNRNVNCLSIIGNTIYAGTDNGIYISNISTDDGVSWLDEDDDGIDNLNGLTPAIKINALKFEFDKLFACTNAGLFIYTTTNSGQTWIINEEPEVNGIINCIEVGNDDDIFIGTDEGIYKSTDEGDNWALVFDENDGDDEDIDIVGKVNCITHNNQMILVGTVDGLIHSTNYGSTWAITYSREVTSLAIGSAGIYLGTKVFGFLISTDGGLNFDPENTQYPASGGISYTLNSILEIGGLIYIATNGGLYKSPSPTPTLSISWSNCNVISSDNYGNTWANIEKTKMLYDNDGELWVACFEPEAPWGDAELINDGQYILSPTYFPNFNCHGYAWHLSEGGQRCTGFLTPHAMHYIPLPESTYTTWQKANWDYIECNSTDPFLEKVTFGNFHSCSKSSRDNDIFTNINNMYFDSKWSRTGPLVHHKLMDNPWANLVNENDIKYWKSKKEVSGDEVSGYITENQAIGRQIITKGPTKIAANNIVSFYTGPMIDHGIHLKDGFHAESGSTFHAYISNKYFDDNPTQNIFKDCNIPWEEEKQSTSPLLSNDTSSDLIINSDILLSDRTLKITSASSENILFDTCRVDDRIFIFSGKGSGTEEDPFQITTLKQLKEMTKDHYNDNHYILMNDIDATETRYWNPDINGQGDTVGYRGFPIINGRNINSLDGRGHIIKNLYVRTGSGGPFSVISDFHCFTLKRIAFVDCFVECPGPFNFFLFGSVDSKDFIIDECYFTGKIILGKVEPLSISCAMGRVYSNTIIKNSYTDFTFVTDSVVSNFGWLHPIDTMGQIKNCYALGQNSSSRVLSPFGYYGNVVSCFWDADKIKVTNDSLGLGLGLSTAEMMKRSTFESAGWDFDNVWYIEEGMDYPKLKCFRDGVGVEDKEPVKSGIAEMSITGNSEKIKIDYSLPAPGQVRIKIFNSLGALEGVIFEGFSQFSDSGSTQFDASALPSGMYFITLESSGIRLCRQYALIK